MPCFTGDGANLDACVLDHLRTQLTELDVRVASLLRARTSLVELLTASTSALAPLS
jgi:hypothetical protein